MPVNKARCGMPAEGSAAMKRPAPSGGGVQRRDGTENVDADAKPIQRPDWQGNGTVVERS